MEPERRRIGRLALLLLGLCLGTALCQDFAALGAEYRQLRTQKGWFEGGPEFLPEIDRWGCRKQQVMEILGRHLGDGEHRQAEVEELLGPPDKLEHPGDPHWSALQGQGADYCLVYTWRGYHDFMYFPVQDGKVLRVDWWMAYE